MMQKKRFLTSLLLTGTKNVLEAVNNSKTVKTVIYTSSGFAIYGDNADIALAPNGALNEDCWNTTSTLEHKLLVL